jgi:hypothetical protein
MHKNTLATIFIKAINEQIDLSVLTVALNCQSPSIKRQQRAMLRQYR